MLTLDYILEQIKSEGVIDNETFEQSLSLDFANKEDFGDSKILRFTNCNFKNSFSISNLQVGLYLEFDNCTLGRFRIVKSKLFKLQFEKCVLGSVSIYSSEIETTVFENSTCKRTFLVSDTKGESVLIQDSSIDRVRIHSKEMEFIDIVSKDSINRLILSNFMNINVRGGIKEVSSNAKEFTSLMIESLYRYIDNKKVDNHKVEIIANRIEEFNLTHHSFSGSITLAELEIDHLKMDGVDSSNGTVRFNEVKIKIAEFYDVAIKSFYWNQVVFKDELFIERCDFSSLNIANVKWLPGKRLSDSFINEPIPFFYPIRKKWLVKFMADKKVNKKNPIYHLRKFLFGSLYNYEDQDVSILLYERETYRQLKATSIANHNLIESLDFYRNEMRLRWKEIRINWSIPFWDRVLIFLSRWVSDFGQNWILPLMWLFVFHTIIYFSIIGFNFSYDYKIFESGTEQYFELLNPVHKTPNYIKGFNVGLELLMRVLDGFFIYHFLRATRKFGKI